MNLTCLVIAVTLTINILVCLWCMTSDRSPWKD